MVRSHHPCLRYPVQLHIQLEQSMLLKAASPPPPPALQITWPALSRSNSLYLVLAHPRGRDGPWHHRVGPVVPWFISACHGPTPPYPVLAWLSTLPWPNSPYPVLAQLALPCAALAHFSLPWPNSPYPVLAQLSLTCPKHPVLAQLSNLSCPGPNP